MQAPPAWRAVECISDLHLQPAHPATVAAWRGYMESTQADALFILGDLFEAWVGDDSAGEPGFEAGCAEVLRTAAAQRPLFLMHGNRDFLVGNGLCELTGIVLLPDPTVFAFGPRRWLLSHGDALCLADTEYLSFRRKVRDPAWQQAVLQHPLAQRRAMARSMRSESEQRQEGVESYAEVDAAAALRWLEAADAGVLIHGHTHRPGEHVLDAEHRRIVLSDWDVEAPSPRAELLRLTVEGAVQRIALA